MVSLPDTLEADLFRVGIITLRLAGENCVRGPVLGSLHEIIRATVTESQSMKTHGGSLKSVWSCSGARLVPNIGRLAGL